jgi:hypothetical protein
MRVAAPSGRIPVCPVLRMNPVAKFVSLLGAENKGVLAAPASFGLAGSFIRIAPKCRTGLSGEFRAAGFDEIAGFGDDVFQNVCQLPDARLAVDELGC